MDVITAIIMVILVMFGIVEMVRMLVFRMLRIDNTAECSVVLRLEDAETSEYLVRSAAEKMRWLDLGKDCRLVCVNVYGDPEIDKICECLSRGYGNLVVSKPEDLEYNIFASTKH